ncbi:uncharacterized protein zgc:100829 [Kryptolebias marmoratus]|uniref:Zgc:100829 n=1 Tax=Kryptolebias marmoratus TaxID=37003 RepID=A0A3Q3BJF9_KRYMA|nr:uncharacterized protein zgc:100829 [Kryptolebias marmoratus]
MLQQILNDMYVDPDVLEGLNDDQKKTLFLKMRQEQVRRWKEREEKAEGQGGDAGPGRARPKKANSKSVSWLLGRDGDVLVVVIGEVDELKSKFICAGTEEKKSPSLQNSSCSQTILKRIRITEDVQPEKESTPSKTQPETSSDFKGQSEKSPLLPLLPEPEAAEEKPAPRSSICSMLPTRAGAVRVRPASANPTLGCVNTRPDLTNPRLETAVPTTSSSSSSSSSIAVKSDSVSASPTKGSLSPKELQKPQESQSGKGFDAVVCRQPGSGEAGTSRTAPACAGRGRVAQLMKTFSVDTPTQAASRGIKPPLPTKPSHLRLTSR